MTKWVVYVLHLEDKKVYVGSTESKNLVMRLSQHFADNNVTAFTAQHKPLPNHPPLISKPLASKEAARTEELVSTLKYMRRYGFDNVRGAHFSRPVLGSEDTSSILRDFLHLDDLCYNCYQTGHYQRLCPNK
jgi:predicted GIY-YIG superfamily endonuclease